MGKAPRKTRDEHILGQMAQMLNDEVSEDTPEWKALCRDHDDWIREEAIVKDAWLSGQELKDLLGKYNFLESDFRLAVDHGKISPYQKDGPTKVKVPSDEYLQSLDSYELIHSAGFFYKREDVEKLLGIKEITSEATDPQRQPEYQHDTAPASAAPPEQRDHETFIRNLQIAYESDTKISIRTGKEQPITYPYDKIGFAREDTKQWRTLINILKSSDNLFHAGVARGAGKIGNKPYSANQKILVEISQKLISLINKVDNIQLPDKTKLFELKKGDYPGTYKPKFIVSNFNIGDEKYADLSKDTLIAEIEKLSGRKAILAGRGDQDSEKEFTQINEELEAKIILALKNNWLGKHRAASYLNPSTED